MFSNFEYLKNIFLKDFSTIKIGGKVDFIVFPRNFLELKNIFKIIKSKKLNYFILGNGSNTLFDDNGFRGVVISLKHFDKIFQKGNYVWVGAGIKTFVLNIKLSKLGLSGFEWSYGIPASLGGMIVSNAGCFGHDMSEIVEEVLIFDGENLRILKRLQIKFEYRNSNLKNFVVLFAKLNLEKDCEKCILKRMNFYKCKKFKSQPCDKPSLGSVFKVVQSEPKIYPAKLIDNLGLKGVKINEIEISQKHAGFFINNGNGTSKDFQKLFKLVSKELQKIGIKAESEIVFLKEKQK